ncbi:MAG: arabinan endo-1,5-alpha-L-arabinosidase, partial [Sphingobacteriales bacterium]
MMTTRKIDIVLLIAMFFIAACKKSGDPPGPPAPEPPVDPPAFDINSIADTYPSITSSGSYLQWGPYNVHDPSIIKSGEYFYSYSTDAAYGTSVRPGIQIRKSKDLVQWNYVGWVFNGLPAIGAGFIAQGGGTAFQSLWAPYIMKAGNEYRLYYSLSCALPRLSVIGLATSSSPEGPWKEQGLVVVSKNDNSIQTNAIDPTVVVTPGGEHWMYYGSAWDGIYVLKLNPATGLAQNNGDKGTRIAQRGFTNSVVNGNIEGPEIIYHPGQAKYYLFIAYDWLETKYNVRVGRSSSPQGPFLDYKGNDINNESDHGPMILAPYKFQNHGGWQGVAHCSVFEDNGQYYMAHQGRPGVDKYYMVMHVRKIFWMENGWPVVSPERFANVPQTAVAAADLAGEWEQIVLGYQVTPGYGEQQTSPDFQQSVNLSLGSDGRINATAGNTWSYSSPWLTLSWANGTFTDKVYVSRERDWENKKT